jgi:transposase-like protein
MQQTSQRSQFVLQFIHPSHLRHIFSHNTHPKQKFTLSKKSLSFRENCSYRFGSIAKKRQVFRGFDRPNRP